MSNDDSYKLDQDFLDSVGLARLPEEEALVLLRHVYETLEFRVGVTLAQQMSVAELDAFEQFIVSDDQDGALRWLEGRFPDYRRLVRDEFEFLSIELRQVAPTMLELVGLPAEAA